MTKTAKVIAYFEDLQDDNRAYHVGDTFPHDEAGYDVTDKRFGELASENNQQRKALIKLDTADDYSDLTVAELKELAKERGIDVPAKSKREDLIALLEK